MTCTRCLSLFVAVSSLLLTPFKLEAAEAFEKCAKIAHGRTVVHFVSFERTYSSESTAFLCVAVETQGTSVIGPGIVAIISSKGKVHWKHKFKGWIGEVTVVSGHRTGLRYDFDTEMKLVKTMGGWPFIYVSEEGLGAKESGGWVMCPWDKTVYYGSSYCEGDGAVTRPKIGPDKSQLIRKTILKLLPDGC